MLYINSTSQDNMKELARLYHLPVRGPKEIANTSILAEYVFQKCFHLIPHDIKEFFKIGRKDNIVKSELIMHMIINAYMVQLNETEGHIKRNGAFFTQVFDFFEVALTNEKPVSNLFGDKNVSRAAQEHFKKLADHWMLTPLNDHSWAIPAFASPFIAFQAVHVDSHKVIKDYKDSQHSWSYLKKHKGKGEKLHLHFYDNFKYLLDQFPTIDKIERSFENNQLSYHPTLNRILFEREYQIGLASKIAMMTMHYPDEIKIQYYRLLSTIAMLPNVNGRLYYLTSMLIGIPFTSRSQVAFIEEKDQVFESLIVDEHLIRVKKIRSALIGMALITIPVMEVYFLYLWKQRIDSIKVPNMKQVMEEYARLLFSDKRVMPLKLFGNASRIFGAQLGGEWELADLPFNQIRDILLILNKVLDGIQMFSLSNIYVRPHQYLENNGYDKYDLLLLNEGQVVKAISEVVEEKHFRTL